MWAGAGVGGLRTPARCLDSDRAYPLPGIRKPGHSALFRGDRSLQLALVHARATLDLEPLGLVVELLLRLPLRAVGAGALPTSTRRRGAARRAARPGPRLAGAGSSLLHCAGRHPLRPGRRRSTSARTSLDLLVLPGTLCALLDATRWHTNHSLCRQISHALRYPSRIGTNRGLPPPERGVTDTDVGGYRRWARRLGIPVRHLDALTRGKLDAGRLDP